MKIIKNKIVCTENAKDQEFRKRLKKVLEEWFKVELQDIIDIIKQIGVTDEEYEIAYKCMVNDYMHFQIITSQENIEVELFKGNLLNQSPHLKVFKNGDEFGIFSIRKVIQLQELSFNLDKEKMSEEEKCLMMWYYGMPIE